MLAQKMPPVEVNFDIGAVSALRHYVDSRAVEPVSITDLLDRTLKPGMTVAVCTYMRANSLQHFLASLAHQVPLPDELVIVDASADLSSEVVLDAVMAKCSLAKEVTYVQVSGTLKGLTRQRNLAVRLGSCDLCAFFDDDTVLREHCLHALETALRQNEDVVGVGAIIANASSTPGWKWNLMRLFRAVPDLVPGRYHRSGFGVPLRFMRSADGNRQVDRLPGCCMIWRVEVLRQVRFSEFFSGYSHGEDMEFSRRASSFGTLLISTEACVEHNHATSGRPDHLRWARMVIRNRYYTHVTTLPGRRMGDTVWFFYASALYSGFIAISLVGRGRLADAAKFLGGSLMGILDIVAVRRYLNTGKPSG